MDAPVTAPPRHRLAIFDFDGTLADSFPWFLKAIDEGALRFGYRRLAAAELEALRGQHARAVMAALGVPAWKLPRIMGFMRRRMGEQIDGIRLFPGVEAMLERLVDRGVQVALLTSNSEANVRRVLGERNAARIAHYACGVSLFGKQARIARLLKAATIPREAAILIGDELRDGEAANAAGIEFGAVEWGFTRAAAFAPCAPVASFATVAGMAAWLAPARA